MLAEAARPFFSTVPLARIGEPDEVAAAVAFFVSSAPSYCKGSSLVVDRGWTLGDSSKTRSRIVESLATNPL